jgi:uroporphyrinogen decarboxylase
MFMNRRDNLLNLIHNQSASEPIPAAFFMHFDAAHHQDQAAVDKHLEFFHHTGMDFIKIQYEQTQPPHPPIRKPEDWMHIPIVGEDFFEPTIHVVEGLVKAAGREALVVMTVYSPFMWAAQLDQAGLIGSHLQENPQAVSQGLAIMTENVLSLVRACKQAGVDGFYVSTQGGEAFRFPNTDLFQRFIKPTDLAVWAEIQACPFNILHICDYVGGYGDLTPFLDYPSHVVNCSLKLGERTLSAREVSELFKRPFMGGLERKGLIATGNAETIRMNVQELLEQAPAHFILAADCTVPSETPWEHLITAIAAAHQFRK